MKIVHYLASRWSRIVLGENAFVHPLNHPDTDRVSNKWPALTSQVQAYDPVTGVFVTQNTVYVPVDQPIAVEQNRTAS